MLSFPINTSRRRTLSLPLVGALALGGCSPESAVVQGPPRVAPNIIKEDLTGAPTAVPTVAAASPVFPAAFVVKQRSIPEFPRFYADCHGIHSDPNCSDIDIVTCLLNDGLRKNELRFVDAVFSAQGYADRLIPLYEAHHASARADVSNMAQEILLAVEAREVLANRELSTLEIVKVINARFFDPQTGYRLIGEPLVRLIDLASALARGSAVGNPGRGLLALSAQLQVAKSRASLRVENANQHRLDVSPEGQAEERHKLLFAPSKAGPKYTDSEDFNEVIAVKQGSDLDLCLAYLSVVDCLDSAGLRIPLTFWRHSSGVSLIVETGADRYEIAFGMGPKLRQITSGEEGVPPASSRSIFQRALAEELLELSQTDSILCHNYMRAELLKGALRLGVETPEMIGRMGYLLGLGLAHADSSETHDKAWSEVFKLMDRADQQRSLCVDSLFIRAQMLGARAGYFGKAQRKMEQEADVYAAARAIDAALTLPLRQSSLTECDLLEFKAQLFAGAYPSVLTQGVFDAAESGLRRVLGVSHRPNENRLVLGELYFARYRADRAAGKAPVQGDLERAQDVFERLIASVGRQEKAGMGFVDAWQVEQSLGEVYVEQGRIQEAVEAFARCVRRTQWREDTRAVVARAEELMAKQEQAGDSEHLKSVVDRMTSEASGKPFRYSARDGHWAY